MIIFINYSSLKLKILTKNKSILNSHIVNLLIQILNYSTYIKLQQKLLIKIKIYATPNYEIYATIAVCYNKLH